METRFTRYKGDWDGFWQFRGQRRPIGIFHGGTFLTAFSRRSFWWYSRRHRTPLQIMANFGGESFQLLNPGTTSCIFCGECLISCEGPIRFKNKIHQIDRILKAVKNVPPWKIPIGRLCPRNCEKPSQSPLLNRVSISSIYIGVWNSIPRYHTKNVHSFAGRVLYK